MSEWTERTHRGVVSFEREIGDGVVEIVYPDGSPERFGDVVSPSFGAVVSPSRPRASIPERSGPPVCDVRRVVFTEWAERNIRSLLGVYDDGRECGAYLMGYRENDAVVVTSVCDANYGQDRTETQTAIDFDKGLYIEREFEVDWVGDLHTHPADTEPSDTDKAHWRTYVRKERSLYAGVIIHPRGVGYRSYADRSAWLADGTAVRPLRIEYDAERSAA